MTTVDNGILHKNFCSSSKKHVLMITNHGIHQWDIIPGLPDTGGQNVFVNQFTETLADQGYKITIVNRGGYAHPVTGDMHVGLSYKDENQRILYIEDSTKGFVRKEDMDTQIEELADDLFDFIKDESIPVDLIISHYWDGAKIAAMLNYKLPQKLTHIWVPHSTGAIKKRNVKPERWETLKVDDRIRNEIEIVREVDSVAYTSFAVQDSLKKDYQVKGGIFLPPCIVVDRFHPETVSDDNEIWSFLSGITGLEAERIKQCKIITEISRTDTTKRKDILIESFAKVHKDNPNTFLIVAIDDNEKELSSSLKARITKHGLEKHVAPIGNEWDRMPTIYRVTDLYCSPSIMEGFGMSVQEAAATKVPVVASTLIPFVREFLMGDEVQELTYSTDDGEKTMRKGAGAFMVEPDDVNGFAAAMSHMLNDDALRSAMGEVAYKIAIPYFTWNAMLKLFLDAIDYTEWDEKENSIAI